MKQKCRRAAMCFTVLLFMLPAACVLAQQNTATVSGTVLTEGGEVLEGVTIIAKNVTTKQKQSLSAVTGNNGVFTFKQLVIGEVYDFSFSFVGYESGMQKGFVVKQAATSNSLLIRLKSKSNPMNEVVVTALGIKRPEKALGYSVTKIDGKQITDAMSNNWSNALVGKVPGLNILKSGGGPGGSNRIILRGENSLMGNSEALLVVDGVIMSGSSGKLTGSQGSGAYLDTDSPTDFGSSINDINPEDIETISVLPGAGAAALYGARGANGAIVITTKSGRSNQKGMGVTFNSNTMFETVSRWPDYQYEYGQGDVGQDTWYSYGVTEDGSSTRSTSSAWGPKFNGQSYYQYDPTASSEVAGKDRTPWVPYKNNRKEFFQTGKTFTNSVTLEGGNAFTSARLSITNLNNSWIIPNTGYDRNSVALSVNQKLSDKLQVSSKVNYTNKKSDNLPSTGYNNQSIMYFIRGMVPNADMNWFKDYWMKGQEDRAQTKPFSNLLDNPYVIANEMLNKMNRHGIVGNISANYTVTPELSLLLRSSLDYSTEFRSQQRSEDTYKFANGMYRTQNIFAQEITHDFMVKYNHTFAKLIKTNFSLGGSAMRNRFIRDEMRADNLLYPGIYTFANSKNPPVAYPYRSAYAVNSIYGLMSFSYKDFLYLDFTGRNDWTSTLATPESDAGTSFFYPSINGSIIMSELVHLPAAISYWKLRGSWANVGSGGTLPFLKSYGYNPTQFTSGLSNPSTIANKDLHSLNTRSFEVGTDIHLFKDRVGIDVALYRNSTINQIIFAPIDRAAGYNTATLNAGEIVNKGIEIRVNATPVKRLNGLTWSLNATFASNAGKVISLVPDVTTYIMSRGPGGGSGSVEARPGGRMGAMYGLGYQRSPEGKIIYDSSGNAKITDTAKYIGNTNAKWKAGLSTELSYKGFRFSVLFDCQYGGSAYSLTTAVLAEEGKLNKTVPGRYNGILGDGVQQNADGSFRPNDIVSTSAGAYYKSHFRRENVEANTFSTDFVKLREARLEYSIPASYLKKIRLQRLSVGIYGRDLFMFTNWPAFDPEFGTLDIDPSDGNRATGLISAGFETAQFPSTRSFGASVIIGL